MIGLDTTFLVEAAILEAPRHAAALGLLDECARDGAPLALAPQVLAEFLHIVTDPARFKLPLAMPDALTAAGQWRTAREVRLVPTDETALALALDWMERFGLGRKRILDTMLAATYKRHGVEAIITSNPKDYEIFGCFELRVPGEN